MFNTKSLKTALVLTVAFQTQAIAEEVKMFNTPPSAEEMGRILFSNGAADQGTEMKTRSISFGKKSPPAEAATPQAAPKKHKKTAKAETAEAPAAASGEAVGLPIEFGYDSANIKDESIPFLTEIGKMLGLEEFAQKRLVIEGHTDAAGSDMYNKYLSQRRAESVKDYLINNYKIASARLIVKGMGESSPLPGSDPNDAVNRRVQLRSAD